jgi:hypothetical protein
MVGGAMIAALTTLAAVWVIGELLPEWRPAVWIALSGLVVSRCAEHCL